MTRRGMLGLKLQKLAPSGFWLVCEILVVSAVCFSRADKGVNTVLEYERLRCFYFNMPYLLLSSS